MSERDRTNGSRVMANTNLNFLAPKSVTQASGHSGQWSVWEKIEGIKLYMCTKFGLNPTNRRRDIAGRDIQVSEIALSSVTPDGHISGHGWPIITKFGLLLCFKLLNVINKSFKNSDHSGGRSGQKFIF